MSFKKIIAYTIIIYTILNGLYFFNQGVYWDDWYIVNTNSAKTLTFCSDFGTPYIGHFFNFIFQWKHSIFIIHSTIFICYLIAFLMQIIIVKKLNFLNNQSVFVFAMFLICLPFNEARICVVDLPWAICYALFFIACYFYLLCNKSILIHLITLILLLISFYTNSLLFFYLIPLSINYYLKNQNNSKLFTLKNIQNWIYKNVFYLIIPFIYLVFKKITFHPTITQLDYNQISISKILSSPKTLYYGILELVFGLCNQMYIALNPFRNLIIICCIALIIYFIKSIIKNNENIKSINKKYFLITAICITLAGLYPYCLIGKIPTYIDFVTRHQLLLPTGVALFFTAVILHIKKSKTSNIVFAFFIGIFILNSIFTKIVYTQEWFKLTSIEKNFIKNKAILDTCNLVLITDNTGAIDIEDQNKFGNEIRFYTWNGIYKKASGKENLFLITNVQYNLAINGNLLPEYLLEKYKNNMNDFTGIKYKTYMTVNYGSYNLGIKNLYKILYNYYFNTPQYLIDVENIVDLKFSNQKE